MSHVTENVLGERERDIYYQVDSIISALSRVSPRAVGSCVSSSQFSVSTSICLSVRLSIFPRLTSVYFNFITMF